MPSTVERQTHRKVFLEMLSLATPITAAVFFSGWFIVSWPLPGTSVVAALTALSLVAYWVWHRSVHPANIAPWASSSDESKDEEDDEEGWDWFTIVLFIVSLVAVVVVGVIARFILALLVIVLFAAAYSNSDFQDVAAATLATLGVSFVLEFAIVIPLCKLWNLSIDEDPPSREDFCPVPTDKT